MLHQSSNTDGQPTVLVVDDEPQIVDFLRMGFTYEGFRVFAALTGPEAIQAAAAHKPDIIILDIMLPSADGLEVTRQIRKTHDTAIIMLTAKDDIDDRVAGLDLGADDYVTKPFRLNVLLARLRAHLRQSEHSDDAVLTIGPYTFRPSAKMLLDPSGRKKVRLTEKETAILKYLYRAGDQAIGRDTLLGEVWGYNAGVTTHTLETHVYRLRQKIERDPTRAEILVTEPGGYRLVP